MKTNDKAAVSSEMLSTYDTLFFDYVSPGATRSAEIVVPLLSDALGIKTVLDVGCGRGAWLSVFIRHGVSKVLGIDGEYVAKNKLLVPESCFLAGDLARGIDLAARFDLVMSLEVAEHLPPESSVTFIESLVRHSDLILFSAAPRGQGGHEHVNEQDYDFWRGLFADQGYLPVDYLRPAIAGQKAVEPWYRYNLMLYVTPARFARLPEMVQQYRVADHERIRDVSPWSYQFRKSLLRCLPVRVKTAMAQGKEMLIVRWQKIWRIKSRSQK